MFNILPTIPTNLCNSNTKSMFNTNYNIQHTTEYRSGVDRDTKYWNFMYNEWVPWTTIKI